MDTVKDLLSGTVAGIAAKFVEFPFDTVKVRLQTDNAQRYRGTVHCFLETVRQERLAGLYRGIGAPIAGAAAENATLFAFFGGTKDLLTSRSSFFAESQRATTAAAGGVAGVAVAHILTPVELVKCRMQVQSLGITATKYKNSWECALGVIRSEGVAGGLFRGHTATLVREVPGNVAWFGAYAEAKRLLEPVGGKDAPWVQMLAGAIAGMSYWTILFPADVVKSQQQTEGGRTSFLSTLRKTWQSGGVPALYRGWSVTMLRAAPANAVIFCVYDQFRAWLDRVTDSGSKPGNDPPPLHAE